MLRFKVFASAVPLILAALLAHGKWPTPAAPCVAVGDTTVQMAQLPWQRAMSVVFTDDPKAATVRVRVVDDPSSADFVVVDDDSTGADACTANRFVTISATPGAATPVIYLTETGKADYRIYVRSATVSLREAAALLVGAHQPARFATASL